MTDYCEAPGCPVYGSLVNGLCTDHRRGVVDVDDGTVRVRIATDAACDNCGALIDGPGFCGRCLRELNQELDEMRSR